MPAEAVEKALLLFLGSGEFTGSIPAEPADAKARVAAAAVKLGPDASTEALAAAITAALDPRPAEAAALDLADSITKPIAEIWRRERTIAWSRALAGELQFSVPEGPKGERFLGAFGSALLDLDREAVLLPASAGAAGTSVSLDIHVTGQPVINEGLSQSVTKNQLRSLLVALALVLVITSAMFRSIRTGFLATGPALLTVAMLYSTKT